MAAVDGEDCDSDKESEVLIDCNGIGNPVYCDPIDQKKFYLEFSIGDLRVKVGDCVRVRIQADSENENPSKKNSRDIDLRDAFGQVLAVFEDSNEEMFIEVMKSNPIAR